MSNPAHESLLQTKLHPPQLSRSLIARPRLLEQLQSPTSLVLVIAPAGYGKTTLVSSWLETVSLPSVWLAIDESDNELATFAQYLIAAIQSRFPGVGARTLKLLSSSATPRVETVSHSLLNELSELNQEFILVLDDYQFIHSGAIHRLLTEILRHPPSALHLVVSARNDPALPLPGLRARGLVTELRAHDLSFSLDEATDFLRNAMKLDLSDEEIAVLKNNTEGWAASLRLAAIYYRQAGGPGLSAADLRRDNRYLVDYMVEQILAFIPAGVRDFLFRTSILDQLCAPLCDGIMGFDAEAGKSQQILRWLEDLELFTLPVARQPGWFRYHHLFRQFLAHELTVASSPPEIARLHLRASAWFEEQGALNKAIMHAFAADDPSAAKAIFARHRRDLTNADDWYAVQRLLKLYPREVIDHDPELLLAEAMVLLFQTQHRLVAEALDRAETVIADAGLEHTERERLEGELAARRAALAYWGGDLAQSSAQAQIALHKIPPEWWQLRLHTKLFLGICFQIEGDLAKALSLFDESAQPDLGPTYHIRRLGQACFIHWAAGDLAEMERAALQMLSESSRGQAPPEGVNWAHFFLGLAHYHRGEPGPAEHELAPILLRPEQAHMMAFISSAALLALISQTRGQRERAHELCDALLSFSRDAGSIPGMAAAAALKAELALNARDLERAAEWAEGFRLPEFVRLPHFYAPVLTYVRILLALDTSPSRRRAATALSTLERVLGAEHQTILLLAVKALKATLLMRKGEGRKARAELETAIQLAEPGGSVRIFVDIGKPVRPMLIELKKEGIHSAFISRILSALDQESALDALNKIPAVIGRDHGIALGVTRREEEVLGLLEKRYTNGEIAEALAISEETVHTHIKHLSGKLGVRGRRAIVEKARELALRPDTHRPDH